MGETCKILHADSDIVLCVKPSGVLSQDAGEQSMPGLLRSALGTEEIYPVHRLDQAVGGVMVYARTAEAAAALSRQIQRGAWEKTYLAVVEGTPEAPEGELVDLLYHDQRRNKTYVVTRERRGVKEARLLYRILATEQGRSLVAIRLLTGRTHQIRVQFASRGLPLVGDSKNPSKTTTYGVGQQIRHAVERGNREILLGLGGSCTNDGGCGCAAALGAKFLDAAGREFV